MTFKNKGIGNERARSPPPTFFVEFNHIVGKQMHSDKEMC